MMIHDFFLSEFSEDPDHDYSLYHGKDADVSLHDSLIQYVADSLMWIPCHNPAMKMETHMGLNYNGPTVLKKAGARKLHEISKAWSILFKQASPEIRLTGAFGWIEGKEPHLGEYEKLVFVRDNVVAKFDLLASLSLRVAESEDEAFLMHLGV